MVKAFTEVGKRGVFSRKRKGICWACFRHVKFEEPSPGSVLACTDASAHELKILKAVTSLGLKG